MVKPQECLVNLTDANFFEYCQNNYINRATSVDEIVQDIDIIKYIKRSLRKYVATNEIKPNLVVNHLKTLYNVFKPSAATKLLFLKVEPDLWPYLKPYLILLQTLPAIVRNVNSADIETVYIPMNQKMVYLIRHYLSQK